jgi:hypothetical protein
MKVKLHLFDKTFNIICEAEIAPLDFAKELSGDLSRASSIYLKTEEGSFIVVPSQAFRNLYFTVENDPRD